MYIQYNRRCDYEQHTYADKIIWSHKIKSSDSTILEELASMAEGKTASFSDCPKG